eukprot:TRINITY_DN6540_c0_g1_i1.p1 TRINITY_DN6540_c0_g1~~TRINITY_DN6540_c0_g1_i1.p1  ORF type:complete len:402 (-),score=75.01 TRINITY_DN6540_c0_g1_i1:80-1285(-)
MELKLVVVLFCLLFVVSSSLSPIEQDIKDAFPGKVKTQSQLNDMIFALKQNVEESRLNGGAMKRSIEALNCPALPLPPPVDNVFSLKPGNIKVVAALGDSITTGSSAKDNNIISMKQYRGLSFSIGGDSGVTTLPNLLKPYNPAVIGFSTGIGGREIATNGLNGAENGGIIQSIPAQANWLLSALKNNSNINFNEDWKLITIWIGSNNLCDVCSDYTYNGPENFEIELRKTLLFIFNNIPRVVVNLLPNLDLTDLRKFSSGGCSLVHSFACPCATSSNAANRQVVQLANTNFTQRIYKLAGEFNEQKSSHQAVVVQPFLIQTLIPERSYLSAADCFHPSAIAHQNLAIGLWNTLIAPVESKPLSWVIGEQAVCATEDTIIQTCAAGNYQCCNEKARSLGLC